MKFVCNNLRLRSVYTKRQTHIYWHRKVHYTKSSTPFFAWKILFLEVKFDHDQWSKATKTDDDLLYLEETTEYHLLEYFLAMRYIVLTQIVPL